MLRSMYSNKSRLRCDKKRSGVRATIGDVAGLRLGMGMGDREFALRNICTVVSLPSLLDTTTHEWHTPRFRVSRCLVIVGNRLCVYRDEKRRAHMSSSIGTGSSRMAHLTVETTPPPPGLVPLPSQLAARVLASETRLHNFLPNAARSTVPCTC